MYEYRVWDYQRVMKKAFARNLYEIQRDFSWQTKEVVDSLVKIYLLPESHNPSFAQGGGLSHEIEKLIEDAYLGMNATYWNMMTNKLPTFNELYDEFFCSWMDTIEVSKEQVAQALSLSSADEVSEKQHEQFKRGLLGFVNAYFVKLCEGLSKEGRLECYCCSTFRWILDLLGRSAEDLWVELQEAPHTLLQNGSSF